MAAKPRRDVLRKAADAGIHPAEPRVAGGTAQPAAPRTSTAGTATSAARSASPSGRRTRKG